MTTVVIERLTDDCDYYRVKTTKIVQQQASKPERDRIARAIRIARRIILSTCWATIGQLAEQRQRAEARRSRQLRFAFSG